jgi:hypothetical protein
VLNHDALMPDAFVHEVSSSVKLLQTLWRGCGELVGKLGAAFPEQRKGVQVELTRMYTDAGNLAIEMQQSYMQGGWRGGARVVESASACSGACCSSSASEACVSQAQHSNTRQMV